VIRLIWSGIDTWEESFRGDLKEETLAALQEKKGQAQEDGNGVAWQLAGKKLYVQPNGLRPWRYLLKNEEMQLRLFSLSYAPALSARLRPLGLVSRGARQLQAELTELAAGLGLEPGGVSRVDIAVDFQGWAPTVADMANVVCDAAFRPIYPNLVHPETFRFGKGDLVFRIYNKTREIAAKHNEWMQRVWAQNPEYDPAEEVWRFEVQFRGVELARLGCKDAASVLEGLPGLLGSALDKCNLRVPTGKNQSRWPEDPRWTELRQVSFAGEPLKRIKAAHYTAGYARCTKMIFSYLLTAAAWLGIYDLDTIWNLLRRGLTDYIELGAKDFAALVKERECKMASKS